MSNPVTQDQTRIVLDALAKPEFKWRSVAGIVKETGLPQELVLQALKEAADQVVRSSVPSTDGQELYTTRKHFSENTSLAAKLLGAIKNRAM